MARKDFEGQSPTGGITDFEFEVTDAFFAEPDPRYLEKLEPGVAAGPVLHLVGRSNYPGHEVLDIDGFHPSYNIAPGWEIVDGGKGLQNADPNAKSMGKAYGRFIEAAFKVTEDIADTDADPFKEGHPSKAETWIGTKWFLVDTEKTFGKGFKSRDLLPTKYLGKVAGGSTPATVAGSSSIPSGLRAQVDAALAASATFPEFQSKLLAISGITQDPALLQEALNPSFFAAAKG
jgi:hypothetical protein